MIRAAVVCAALLALSACGVKGDLEPPAGVKDTGPRDRIYYPEQTPQQKEDAKRRPE